VSARTGIRLRTVPYSTVAATGEFYAHAALPEIWLWRQRKGLLVHWELTKGEFGVDLAFGHAWTRDQAFYEARAVSYRKDIVQKAGAR
jgi:hypothetical protein